MKKTKETKAKSKYGAYKVSMTIVYENDGKEGNVISDELWTAFKSSGIDVKLMHVDSIRQVANPEKAISQIMAGISGKQEDSMKTGTTSDGNGFISIDI